MHKFDIPCLNTGSFAKLCNTNKRTLIHYHDIGLFVPAYVDEKGYRYYSESQCDVFFTIHYLRELGMPLQEIRSYLNKQNPEVLKELLFSQKKKVSQEIARLKRIENVIHTKIGLLELSEQPRIQQTPTVIMIEETPEEYLISSDSIQSNDHDIIFQSLCKHLHYCNIHQLNCGHPYGAMQTVTDLLNRTWDSYAYFFTKITAPITTHPYEIKPAGSYLVTYLIGDYYDISETYERIISYIKNHHLTVGPHLYKEAILDEIAADSSDGYITKISILLL